MDLLTIDEAAKRMRVSRDGVRRLIESRRLRAGKLAGVWRVDGASVDAYMQEQFGDSHPEAVTSGVDDMIRKFGGRR